MVLCTIPEYGKYGGKTYADLSLLSSLTILSYRVVAALKSPTASDSMPRCCPCNSSGRCIRCVCVQDKRNCDNCAPSYQDCCSNQPQNSTRSQTALAKDHPPQSSEANFVITEANSASSPTDAAGPPDPPSPLAIVASAPVVCPDAEPSARFSPPELPPYQSSSQPAFTWGQLDG